MEAPLVSVIICFLNPGSWLIEAIESVLKQTFQNWQLILVDDGSQDSDRKIAMDYATQHPKRVIYIDHVDHKNIGLTASRNKGIEQATGTMIAFLDADDYWYNEKLENQLQIFRNFPEAMMICEASRFWYSWQDPQCNDPIIYIGVYEGLYQPGELSKLLYPLGQGQPPCPTGILLKREALCRFGAFEESFKGVYQLYEDQAFLAKMYLNVPVYISAACHNKYRKHESSMSSAAGDQSIYRKVRNFFLDWLIDYIHKEQILDAQLEAMIEAVRLTDLITDPE